MRAIPWILAIVSTIAFAASFSELTRVRKRFGEITQHTFHDHTDVRQAIIRTSLSQATRPIIIVGDSIAEMAPLPIEVSGHEVINAGIGGITSRELVWISPRFLEGVTATLIVVSTGANDVGSALNVEEYSKLLRVLKPHAQQLLVMPSTQDEAVITNLKKACVDNAVDILVVAIPTEGRMPDGVHLNRTGYRIWMQTLASYMMRIM
ncbi:SGNH/GDSL hydrolase family protein [Bradyrhizobium sp. AUGA SZCCT0169]|uniref:SGNH/GDSL hydrolase family protein n=1 Tax=Bradyrhizobium sp. AUGA SZCCT0169 TaxID=2807663 RepID=UPI001BA481FD|nr:SGNH/GDSL hydrolase family protein [Bradyrhizobium sp. AUGA SZCCT0169]MBR1249408.1 SGNH/GDSL hydrolase family protein [Bradyrhizobium sp. AUGA SZCCT0169]